MSAFQRQLHLTRWLAFALLGALIVTLVVTGAAQGAPPVPEKALAHLSQSVSIRHWLAHPDQAPPQLQESLQRLPAALQRAGQQSASAVAAVPSPFNLDTFGLPQNEESIAVCHAHPSTVLGGTNDYRSDPEFNLTGWHFSSDGGNTLENEGLLPSVHLAIADVDRPSGGDPVEAADDSCNLFAGSLNYDPFNPFFQSNGVGVYKSDPASLASCPGGSDPSCWPTRRAVAESEPNHFLDKEWLDVGVSGKAGEVVWVVYSDFTFDFTEFSSTSAIKAVRCDANLVSCTAPILISGNDQNTQFGDVTIGPDGRTYITWSEIPGELEQTAQTFVHKLRIAPAGSTKFGPTRVIARETLAIPFGGKLHSNDFRVATEPKNEVVMVDGHPRIFVVWDACSARPLGFICEEPQIKLKFSDNNGVRWSPEIVLSQGGDNYFPTIAADPVSQNLAVAWYTSRNDPLFHNRQDVELVTLDPSSVSVTQRQIVTPVSNETEADPALGGFFIGDYFEVAADQGTAYIHFNANYRSTQFLGEGLPIPQQDNFLIKASQ